MCRLSLGASQYSENTWVERALDWCCVDAAVVVIISLTNVIPIIQN